MNLLFLTPQLPHPPRQGTAIRNWGLIEHLAERHAITLLSFADEGQRVTPELEQACRRVIALPVPLHTRAARLRTLLSPHADLARRLWSPEFERALIQLLRETQFDAAHVEGLEMGQYLAALQTQLRLVRLYDAHNAEHLLQRRACETDLRQLSRWPVALYSWLQLPRLRKFETETLRAAQAVTCVSAEDAAALQSLAPGIAPTIIPNGIDIARYSRLATHNFTNGFASPSGTQLVFTGKMDYRPNIDAVLWFAAESWPRIRAARPEMQFVIVGQKPAAKVLALNGRDGIVVTGAVDDVRPMIAEAAAYVAPLRMGGGTRFKLLEAMALARPIVSTRLGAEGFAVRNGREMLLADSPAEFAQAVLSLLNDPARAEALGQAGRAFVEKHCDWKMIVPRLEEVYARGESRSAG